MNRRDFLTASTLAGLAPLSTLSAMSPENQAQPEYYELRQYHLPYGSKQRRVHDFLKTAAIPALNRHGIGPVGVFSVMYGPSSPSLFVLLPHKDLESVGSLRRRLATDSEYKKAGAEFLDVPLDDPSYVRMESSLMRAFTDIPKLEVPSGAATGKPRIFELRRYESHSDEAALRKIEMFNRGGEIAIFRKTGLQPVFFAEALVGQHLPHLTYMLTFEDMQARDAAWDRFREDPEWHKLSRDPYYAGTVSSISDYILRPTDYSQV